MIEAAGGLPATRDELVDALLALTKSDDERVRLGAIQAALDRGYGKPAQAVQLGADPDSAPVVFHMDFGAGLNRAVIARGHPQV